MSIRKNYLGNKCRAPTAQHLMQGLAGDAIDRNGEQRTTQVPQLDTAEQSAEHATRGNLGSTDRT